MFEPGAPMSLAGRPWLERYLAEFDYMIEDMVSSECYKLFWFRGIAKRHVSMMMIEFPLLVRSLNGREYFLKSQVYVIDADVVFLCINNNLEQWRVNLNIGKKVLESCIQT